jgi:hypothetical protein
MSHHAWSTSPSLHVHHPSTHDAADPLAGAQQASTALRELCHRPLSSQW